MLTVGQALALLAESGLVLTREQLLALLRGQAISGAVHDPENDEWQIPAAEVAAYASFRNRQKRRNRFAAAGAFALAASTGLAAFTGNFDDITKFTCERMQLACPPKAPDPPVFAAKMGLEDQVCPTAYIVPEEHKNRVTSLVGKPQFEVVSALNEEMKADKWTMTGILNVEIFVSGKNIGGSRPILPNKFSYVVKRLSDGPSGVMAITTDGCGAGLVTLSFEAGELLASPHPYLDEVRLVNSSSGEVYKKLTLEAGEVLYYNSKLICKEDGIYQVSARFPYTLNGNEGEIISPPMNIFCPGRIHMIGDDTDDLVDYGVGLLQTNGFYASEAHIKARSEAAASQSPLVRVPGTELPPAAGLRLPEQPDSP